MAVVRRDLLTELHSALPDKILIAFRGKLAGRLRSEAGVASLVKMIKLIPSVSPCPWRADCFSLSS